MSPFKRQKRRAHLSPPPDKLRKTFYFDVQISGQLKALAAANRRSESAMLRELILQAGLPQEAAPTAN